MTDKADGHASSAAEEADALDEVERNTKSQTTAASYTTTNHEVIRAWAGARGGRPQTSDGEISRFNKFVRPDDER